MLPKCECGADRVPGRTITASEFDEAVESCITEDATVPPHKFAERLGVVCVPDPEPTNAEKLAQLHDQYTRFPVQHLPGNGSFADYLDHKGVKAPGGGDE